jgi:hypothetical protein
MSKKNNKDIEGTERIKIGKIKKRIKFYGIIAKDRKQVYYSDKKLGYILELVSNLDYIVTSILSGFLDKMLIIDEDQNELYMYFFERENFLHVLSGNFSEKDANWLFNKLNFYFLDLMKKNNLNSENFSEKKKYLFNKDMERIMNQIETDVSLKIQVKQPKFFNSIFLPIFLRRDVQAAKSLQMAIDNFKDPYVNIKPVDYLKMNDAVGSTFEPLLDSTLCFDELTEKDDIIEFKKSILIAKIEAIAVNILGNTGAYPRWISVKTDFQKYKYLIFKKEKNNYFSCYISEGIL